MNVWRLKSMEKSFSWNAESDTQGGKVVACAAGLVRKINMLLSVANDSSDVRTKTVRLASAKQKLYELLSIEANYPAVRITHLAEVQAGIARIESDLMNCLLQADGEGTLWKFHAGLHLDTPLAELLYHGIVERGPVAGLSKYAGGASRSGWRQLLPTLREMGCDTDEPPQSVASDIGTIQADGGLFIGFLMVFRKIVESGSSVEQIEDALNVFSARSEFTAEVFEKLGPARRMMRCSGNF